jgi:hypothetical protein
VGFAPVERPAAVIIVVLDEPEGLHQGGQVSAPVFSAIADQILPYLDVMPDTVPDAQPTTAAGQLASNSTHARGASSRSSVDTSGEHEGVASENAGLPEVTRGRAGAGEISEVVYAPSGGGALLMPDLRGRSVRDVARICTELGLELEAHGEGRAVRQSPAVGESVEVGRTVRIDFGRSD